MIVNWYSRERQQFLVSRAEAFERALGDLLSPKGGETGNIYSAGLHFALALAVVPVEEKNTLRGRSRWTQGMLVLS